MRQKMLAEFIKFYELVQTNVLHQLSGKLDDLIDSFPDSPEWGQWLRAREAVECVLNGRNSARDHGVGSAPCERESPDGN